MRNKKTVLFGISILGCMGIILAASNGIDIVSADSAPEVWNHYPGVEAELDKDGYKEYWVNCTTHEVVFSEPQSGTINEGTLTELQIMDLANYDDGRFETRFRISTNEFAYGKYPQSVVTNTSVVNALESINVTNSKGYKEYNGNEYIKVSSNYYKVEPIVWKVLSSDSDSVLLLSEEILYGMRFDDDSNAYENSEIRSWLTVNFFDKAFKQINAIEEDDDTGDKIFLLSRSDYLNDSYGFSTSSEGSQTRVAQPTQYAKACGCYEYATAGVNYGNSYYWTHTAKEGGSSQAYYVGSGGRCDASSDVFSVTLSNCGVRPAIRLNLDPTYPLKESGRIPTYDSATNTVKYGMYPRTAINDSTILTALNNMYENSSHEQKEYVYGGQLYYPEVSHLAASVNWNFKNGDKILDNTLYWYRVEPITWKVLSSSENDKFLFATEAITCSKFDDSSNNYENSYIRHWLNNDFYNMAFGTSDSYIKVTTVVNSGCSDTEDKIFLLSMSETLDSSYGFRSSYGGVCDTAKQRKPTDYCVAHGNNPNEDTGNAGYSYCGYRTRTPGSNNKNACVYSGGYVNSGDPIIGTNYGIVPAMHISL